MSATVFVPQSLEVVQGSNWPRTEGVIACAGITTVISPLVKSNTAILPTFKRTRSGKAVTDHTPGLSDSANSMDRASLMAALFRLSESG